MLVRWYCCLSDNTEYIANLSSEQFSGHYHYFYEMRTLCVSLFFVLPVIVYGQRELTQEDVQRVALEQSASVIDRYEFAHRKNIIFLVKVAGKRNLVKVKEGNWPDNTEYIYSILRDTNGKVVLIEQSPYSQSGDWYIECKHYFGTHEKTFAFRKRETVFDESVKGGVAMETFFRFYDDKFNLTNKTYRITDKDDKLINRNKNEFDFRDFKETVYKNVSDCLKAYNINLKDK